MGVRLHAAADLLLCDLVNLEEPSYDLPGFGDNTEAIRVYSRACTARILLELTELVNFVSPQRLRDAPRVGYTCVCD